jgi:hypothetical protein
MATDKSINIRQVEATEKLALELAEIKAMLAEVKALLTATKQPETKLQDADRQVSPRQGGR